MKRIVSFGILVLIMGVFAACNQEINIHSRLQDVSPLQEEYAGVIVPPNIAPVNFFTKAEDGSEGLVLTFGERQLHTRCKDGAVIPSLKEWKALLKDAKGDSIGVDHCVLTADGWKAYQRFFLRVAEEAIDPYLAYRLIPPGYAMWNEMGIYQRNLENFEETAILQNRQTGNNCMNCHSFCNQDPDRMVFHLRSTYPGTMLINGDKMTNLNTKTEGTISPLVYPYWHPSGKYIAFSVNETKQSFHSNHPDRIEVYDKQSDVVVYDVERNVLLTDSALFSKDVFETFPAFSPDGKRLLFCAAEAKAMPDEYEEVKYHLCSLDFDAESGSFGQVVDTLVHTGEMGKSVSFPRISPDGRFLMLTLSEYGTFSIWHQNADLWMLDMESSDWVGIQPLNSSSVESYHTWSSNSRWVVFSSRRMDGLYTRPYIAYVGADGKVGKPFVLPQERGNFYKNLMYSYNIPELIKRKVDVDRHELVQKVIEGNTRQVGNVITFKR